MKDKNARPQEPDDEPRCIKAGDLLYLADTDNSRAWIQCANPQEAEL